MANDRGKLLKAPRQPHPISCVADLVQESLNLDSGGNRRGTYFRGQADHTWKLVPQIARIETIFHAGKPIEVFNRAAQERDLFDRFRRHTYEQRGRVLNEWEALFLARHHNLPVRLLDWTHNPLVALYFAALHSRENQGDGAIWWIRRRMPGNGHQVADNVDVFGTRSPFDYEGVRMVFPFYPTMRMTNQSGIFTIHSPEWWKDLRDVTESEVHAIWKRRDRNGTGFDIREGGLWIVPQSKKAQILEELERFGINDRTMFPELDGLARGLMQTERFRTGPEYPKES
jgi:hypothetical protein